MGDLATIAGCWLAWCGLHSLMIWPTVGRRLQEVLGRYHYCFRLLYCTVSLVTLVPVLAITALAPGDLVFSWSGGWRLLQLLLFCGAILLFAAGSRHYDFDVLLGLRQFRERRLHSVLSGDGHFSRRGILGVTRHPWYLGSLCFLWSFLPCYYQSSVIAVTVLSMYLVIGTLLEEYKLVQEHGEQYRQYQQEVSMLFPLKWLKKHFKQRK